MSQANAQQSINGLSTGDIVKFIKIVVGLAIMFFGPFTEAPQFVFEATEKLKAMNFPIIDGMATVAMSQAGWVAVTIFAGTLWLWILVDTLWPSVLAIVVLALNPNYQVAAVASAYLGQQTTFLMLFLYFFTAALTRSNIVSYISNLLLTQEKLQGRPWAFMFAIMCIMYVAALLDVVAAVLVVWPVIYLILSEIGHKPGDRLSTFMVGNIVGIALLAAVADVIKGPFFYVNLAYTAFLGKNPQLGLEPINPVLWFVFCIIISILVMVAILFAMRFIFRVDVSPLANLDLQKFKNNKLPPMSWKDKTLVTLLLIYVAWMVLPAVLPASPAVMWWKSKTSIGSMALFFVLLAARRKGDPLINLPQVAAAVPWGIFFLMATVFYFGGVITTPATNIGIILEMLISQALAGMGETTFIAMVIVLAFVLTNLMNSIVCGIILSPIIATIALSYGFDTLPIVVLFFYVLLSAILTPAAGFPGAMLYGNKEWLPGSQAPFYAIFFSVIITIITVIVGIPLARIFF